MATASPLQESLTGVRRRARQATLAHGVGWALVVVLVGLLLAGGLDYFLRVESTTVRLSLSAALLLATGWAVYRFVLPAVASQPSDLALAQRIQSRFPELKDKLASAAEFAAQSEEDVLAGSPALRRAVIVEVTAAVEGLPLQEVVDRRPALVALAAAAAALCGILLVTVISPVTSRTALARLIHPLGNNPWPRWNQLVFVDPPTRLAAGAVFEVEVRDANGRLPEEVFIEYRFEHDHSSHTVTEAMRPIGNAMVAVREKVRRSFQYRAFGGDHQTMAWHELVVVEPPRVESLSITIHPPAYSGWPTSTSTGQIVGLAGSTLRLTARVSPPAKTAAVVLQDGQSLPAEVSADGRQVSVPPPDGPPWQVVQSGTYSLALVDAEGISDTAADKWQIRVIKDQPPIVSIEKPAGEIYVTPAARVPLRVVAKDRLAIREIALKYIRSDASDRGEQQFPLYEGPDQVPATATQQSLAELAEGERRVAEQDWQLAPLKLSPGTQITFHAAARDYQPAEGKSHAQRLLVISRQAMAERLARRQAAILSELAQIVKRQKDTRTRTRELEIQLEEVGSGTEEDLDQLQSIELAQRDVHRALAGQRDSIQDRIASVLADVRNNQLDNASLSRQLDQLAEQINQLDRDDLPAIERSLGAARKNVQVEVDRRKREEDPAAAGQPKDQPPQPATDGTDPQLSRQSRDALQQLNEAGQHQDQVIAQLEETLVDLQRWDNYRRFASDLATLQDAQDKIHDQTDNLRQRTLGRDLKQLAAQDRADLKKLANRQMELARRFDKILQNMDQSARNFAEPDPLAAAAISDATHYARQKGIGNQLRSAGQNVERNQVGQATAGQQAASRDLKEMQDILSNRREQELSRLVKKLQEAEAELQQIQQRQAGLSKKIQEAEKLADDQQRRRQLQRLTRQQRQLQEESERLTRKLRRLQAHRAGSQLAKAAAGMGKSSEAGQAGDAAAAGEHAQQAEQDLAEAQRQLAQARRQAEADLAQELLAKLQDQLKSLVDRQQAVLETTQSLENRRVTQGHLTRGQLAGVRQLSAQQESLYDETRLTAEKLAGAEVFQRTLGRAADKMKHAAQQLARFETGVATQQVEQEALDRLSLLIEALVPDKPEGDAGAAPRGAGQGGGNQGGRPPSLAELKLLKLLQADLNQRTADNRAALEQKTAANKDSKELLQQRAQLAQEQGELADMMFQMLENDPEPPEDDPDTLPDVGPGPKPILPD
ncbi:MAG: hypothetical protein GTO53_05500 [Planctomycetales bacterium]|nr:hypothetical protein [Planctomycetales bacterium]NIM08603.1 hypothetical protein [Planctomycetales bacterium]NIN08071.1 hypothetical protein [Planctomycetales bacterium]NIN77205.1 hypothetical protein [Planctomycetales bacterium]NIO34387.1 hypothetical protein [Planctomycetales bacterium]